MRPNTAIELCGADPYKFAELRELGLINEQINWKQRFFVPSDEASGINILESLLERYPVMLTGGDVSYGESKAPEIEPQAQMSAIMIVDLDKWNVAIAKTNSEDQTADEIDQPVETVEPVAATEEGKPFTLRQEAVSWTHFRQSEQTQLAFSFG